MRRGVTIVGAGSALVGAGGGGEKEEGSDDKGLKWRVLGWMCVGVGKGGRGGAIGVEGLAGVVLFGCCGG